MMLITRRSSPIPRLLRDERLPWSICVTIKTAIFKLKSIAVGALIHAPGIYLGPGCVLRGTAFISFGQSIYVHGHLWLEAVVSYRGQIFTPQIDIGDDVSLSERVHITCIEKITIEKSVLIGSNVHISDHNHGIYQGLMQSHPEEIPSARALGGGGPVLIEENAWIGDNVVIVGPVKIGRGAVVAANAVVKKDVPAYTIVGGIPARSLRRFDTETRQWIRGQDDE